MAGGANETVIGQVKNIASAVFRVSEEQIKDIVQLGGMTNISFRVTVNDKGYVIRIPGKGTEDIIDRTVEKENSNVAALLGISPGLIYFDEEKGTKITEMITSAEHLTPEAMKSKKMIQLAADLFRELHDSQLKMKNNFDPFQCLEKYETLATKGNSRLYQGYHHVKNELLELKNYYDGFQVELRPCHNDAVLNNMIKNPGGRLYLIDWEYSGMGDPMWDLATFIVSANLSAAEADLFLNDYFRHKIQWNDQQKIMLNQIFQDFIWSVWAVFKEGRGDRFGPYGIERFRRAQSNITLFREKYMGA